MKKGLLWRKIKIFFHGFHKIPVHRKDKQGFFMRFSILPIKNDKELLII